MSGLLDVLQRYIHTEGPMDLGRYMELCLTHPEFGYYITRDPLGKAGDFVTSPEVSQMFGEAIGLWSAMLWTDNASPDKLNIIELGPGRGTLMADFLRGTRNVPNFHTSLSISFVEKSPVLRAKQEEAVREAGFEGQVLWADDLDELSVEGVSFILANEFIDALPIRQFEYADKGWMERSISCQDDGALCMGLLPTPLAGFIEGLNKSPSVGDVYEYSPMRNAYIDRIAQHLNKNSGAALFIDYGHDKQNALGDTFQAMINHEYTDPLENSGMADLTSHVDFFRIRECAEQQGCKTYPSVEQGEFLHKLGIGKRAELLVEKFPDKAHDIYNSYKRLTDADQMGALFRVQCITSGLDGEPLL